MGQFRGFVDLDPGPGEFDVAGAGVDDGFVVVFDTGGSFLSGGAVGGPGNDTVQGARFMEDGRLIISGNFSDVADLNPGLSEEAPFSSRGFSDVFVASLDPTLDADWIQVAGGAAQDFVRAIDVSAGGGIYVAGGYGPFMEFAAHGTTFRFNSWGSDGSFLWNLDLDGEFEWAGRIYSTESNRIEALVVPGVGRTDSGWHFSRWRRPGLRCSGIRLELGRRGRCFCRQSPGCGAAPAEDSGA